jgi:hypothetical protein
MARRHHRPEYYYEERREPDNNRSSIDSDDDMEMDILEARRQYNIGKKYGIGVIIVVTILIFYITSYDFYLTGIFFCGVLFFYTAALLGTYLRVRACESRYRNKLSIRNEFRNR